MSQPGRVLDEIQRLARLQFSTAEIELLVGCSMTTPQRRNAMQRGRLEAEADVREALLEEAKRGNAQASVEYLTLVARRKNAELEDSEDDD
jgi:hypothetical protein